MKHGEAGNVAAGAKERGRAERNEPGVPKQQIEPQSIERVDRDFSCEAGGDPIRGNMNGRTATRTPAIRIG